MRGQERRKRQKGVKSWNPVNIQRKSGWLRKMHLWTGNENGNETTSKEHFRMYTINSRKQYDVLHDNLAFELFNDRPQHCPNTALV